MDDEGLVSRKVVGDCLSVLPSSASINDKVMLCLALSVWNCLDYTKAIALHVYPVIFSA